MATFYAKGRLGRNACIEATVHESMTATAEHDHITERQFLIALRKQYPERSWSITSQRFGYWIAHGK